MNNMNSFSQLAEFLGTNPWLSIISFVIAVMGVALAIVFYIKGKRVKLPYYAIRSANIVSDFGSWMKPLEMRYSSQLIENLTVTKMAFWNAGRDTIDHQDIARADPLTLHVKESYKILDAKILSEKTPANKFSITTSPDQSSLTLEFDYIDKDEGAVIQLIHTGKSGEDIDFGGSIKGAGKPIRKLSEERQFRYRFNRPIKARRITSGTGRSSIRDKIDTLFFFYSDGSYHFYTRIFDTRFGDFWIFYTVWNNHQSYACNSLLFRGIFGNNIVTGTPKKAT